MNAPMNAPASQSLFMIGSDGYDTLEEALKAADNMPRDITITLTTDLKINKDRTIEYRAPNGAIYTKIEKVNASYTISQKKEGTVTLDLDGHKLQGYFDINLSSPIQMIIKNGLLQGGHYYAYDDGSDQINYDFDVTSSDASIVFQDLELDNIWAGYSAEADPTAPYVFQLLRCRNDKLVNDDSFAENAHSLTFGSRVKKCKVLIKDSRLYKLMSAEIWWQQTGPSEQHTSVILDNSVVSGAGDDSDYNPSPVFNVSTGGLLDQYNAMAYDSDDSNLHEFRMAHEDMWSDLINEFNPPAYVANQTVRWTTAEQLESEEEANPYDLGMEAVMMVPTTTVKVGVIFEDGHEQDYPDLGLACTVKTKPVLVSTPAEEQSNKDTYYEETRKLASIRNYDYDTGTVSYSPYDPYFYVPSKFYNMQGNDPANDMTVDAGATVVEYKYQDGTIATSSENGIFSPAALSPTEGNDASSSTDKPSFQEVYDLEWNDPNHSLVTLDDGTQFYDYRLKAVRKKYEVVFNANKGNDAPASETLRYFEDSIKNPDITDMKRDGYTFTGWYLDSAATKKFENFGKVLNREVMETLTQEGVLAEGSNTITLFAGWKKNKVDEEPPAQSAQPTEKSNPTQTTKESKERSADSARISTPVSSTGKLFIPKTGVISGQEPEDN